MLFFFGVYQPSTEDREVIATARTAIRRLGLLMKQAAAMVGVPERYLDDALSGRRPLKFSNLYRIEGFRRAFMQATAEAENCCCYPNEQVSLVIHVNANGRPMLKASLPQAKQEEVA